MGTMFAKAPIVPTVAAVQVLRIYFDGDCRYCGRQRPRTSVQSTLSAHQWWLTSTSAPAIRSNWSANSRFEDRFPSRKARTIDEHTNPNAYLAN
jgi:hypothetical protein